MGIAGRGTPKTKEKIEKHNDALSQKALLEYAMCEGLAPVAKGEELRSLSEMRTTAVKYHLA